MPAPLLKLLSLVATESTDAELLGRFVTSRDETAFAELVRRHGPAVYRVCRRLVGRSSADDAFQATFLVLACRAQSVRNAGSVGSWLIGVAGRVSRQMRLADGRRANRERERAGAIEAPPLAHARGSPDATELAAVLDDELTRLPGRLRDPLVLCLLDGRTQEQAAAELGGSVRTLRRRLDQAKALLRLRLERRGVVPAVAAGLVAGAGGPAVAVPPELERRTVAGVCEFLAGGSVTPAAVVAKGVVASMVKLKTSASVGMASVTAVLIGLGVGWADDQPPADPSQPLPPLVAAPPLAGQPTPSPADPLIPPPVPNLPGAGRPAPGGIHRTEGFVVYAPSVVMARVIGAEAEYHRTHIALLWRGKTLPHRGNEPIQIRYTPATGASAGSSTFRIGLLLPFGPPALVGGEVELRGDFIRVLTNELPHEVMHVVLAEHFGKPLPRWADEGIALTAEPIEEQVSHDTRCRELLNSGRGIRLRRLFPMTEYPKDMVALYAQGHSVVRFLLACSERGGLPVLSKIPHLGEVFTVAPADHRKRVLVFLAFGMEGNSAESWNRAAKDVYGFDTVDKLEEAWLEWLKKPESRPARPGASPPALTRPGDDKPDLIPPTRLPGGEPKQ